MPRIYDIPSKFTTSEMQCPCLCGFGALEEDYDRLLIDWLNIIRLLHGKPMIINSGARCATHNAKVGGEPSSAHLPHPVTKKCRAADIRISSSQDRHELLRLAYLLGFQRTGDGTGLIHLDTAHDLPQPVSWVY